MKFEVHKSKAMHTCKKNSTNRTRSLKLTSTNHEFFEYHPEIIPLKMYKQWLKKANQKIKSIKKNKQRTN